MRKKIEKLEEAATHVEIVIEDIAYVIEAWTKIPVQRITEDEADRLLILEDRLKRRVIGRILQLKLCQRLLEEIVLVSEK